VPPRAPCTAILARMSTSVSSELGAPLIFKPHYQVVVWGGRRMAAYRAGLPEGPVGESWDLADHERGMSVVVEGPLKGRTLRDLVSEFGPALVGESYVGGPFPLLVKLIDASDRLSVQVHPDDAGAQALGLGRYGKTECWFMVGDGGELFQGTKPGVDKAVFETALQDKTVETTLNRFECNRGDFFFLEAQTVHALGTGCLLYEVQQTSDITFRVWDWGRVGLDGKPRPMHISESLQTIDFGRSGFGPVGAESGDHPDGGTRRELASCPYFQVETRSIQSTTRHGGQDADGRRACSVVTCTQGSGQISTDQGQVRVEAMQTVLIPAAAGGWFAEANSEGFELLHAIPKAA